MARRPSAAPLNGGGFLIGDQNNTLRNSIAYNTWRGGYFWVWPDSAGPTTGNKFYNNTIYEAAFLELNISAGTTNSTFTNNIVVGFTSNVVDNGISTVLTTNRTIGLITDCTVSSSDFHLKAGAPCTDAGTTVSTVGDGFCGRDPSAGIGLRHRGARSVLRIRLSAALCPEEPECELIAPAQGNPQYLIERVYRSQPEIFHLVHEELLFTGSITTFTPLLCLQSIDDNPFMFMTKVCSWHITHSHTVERFLVVS